MSAAVYLLALVGGGTITATVVIVALVAASPVTTTRPPERKPARTRVDRMRPGPERGGVWVIDATNDSDAAERILAEAIRCSGR
jgi:hypothetical protein